MEGLHYETNLASNVPIVFLLSKTDILNALQAFREQLHLPTMVLLFKMVMLRLQVLVSYKCLTFLWLTKDCNYYNIFTFVAVKRTYF